MWPEKTLLPPRIYLCGGVLLYFVLFFSLSLQNPCQFGVVPSPHSYKWLWLLEGFPFLLGQGKWCLNSIILVMMPFFSFGLLSLLWQWRRMMDRLFRRLWICEEDFFTNVLQIKSFVGHDLRKYNAVFLFVNQEFSGQIFSWNNLMFNFPSLNQKF